MSNDATKILAPRLRKLNDALLHFDRALKVFEDINTEGVAD